MRPARAPPSIDMLQIVMRFSIDSERTNFARVLDAITNAAARRDLAMRYRITSLAVMPGSRRPSTTELQGLGFRLQQRLRGHDVLHFTRADAERKGAERAVGRCVAVAADDRHAGLRVALLGTDHMDDSLPRGRGCRTA